jgi:hypothetical protein
MATLFRIVLGVTLLTTGALSVVGVLETVAYAGGESSCEDNGCSDRGGSYPPTCSGGGGCSANGSATCACDNVSGPGNNCGCREQD